MKSDTAIKTHQNSSTRPHLPIIHQKTPIRLQRHPTSADHIMQINNGWSSPFASIVLLNWPNLFVKRWYWTAKGATQINTARGGQGQPCTNTNLTCSFPAASLLCSFHSRCTHTHTREMGIKRLSSQFGRGYVSHTTPSFVPSFKPLTRYLSLTNLSLVGLRGGRFMMSFSADS